MVVERFVVVLGSALMIAGCSGSGTAFTARTLQNRLQTQLAPQVASHDVAIQPKPDGAEVTLSEPSLFVPNQANLGANGSYVVASVAESLLDPRLMQVDVMGSPTTLDYLRQSRVDSVRNYLEAYSLGPTLPISAQSPSTTAAPQAMTITIHVQCPPGPQGSTWGYPNRGATCN